MTEEEKLAEETFASVHPSDEYVRGENAALKWIVRELLKAMVVGCDRSP